MKIVLIYPPPWKIAADDEPPYAVGGAPTGSDPRRRAAGDMDTLTMPNGVLSLAVQARAAGHEVEVFNLYDFPWSQITALLRSMKADVFGMSCLTTNRRGTAYLAEFLRQHHPESHIVVGGPHVTALPRETLRFTPAIDTVVVGEGEWTFMELLERLAKGEPATGIAGTAYREDGEVRMAPARDRQDIDELLPVAEQFPSRVVLTSRGCPFNCTFCGSEVVWGRKVRFHSVDYTLDVLERLVNEHGLKNLAIKDDTFTANKKRAQAICEGIIERGIDFVWSCDTRANCLSEELLHVMRRAGCQRLSFGVESADPKVLESIGKKISPEMVFKATRMAQKFGFHIRYYMIVGNRGETRATLKKNQDFIRKARPNEAFYYLMSLLPGTAEYQIAGLPQDFYFQSDISVISDYLGDPKDKAVALKWMTENGGGQECWKYGVKERRKIRALFPDLHTATFDLAVALAEAGQFEQAEQAFRQAGEQGYPMAALLSNNLACIAAAQGDADAAERHLEEALAEGFFKLAADNLAVLRASPEGEAPPRLKVSGWEPFARYQQPEVPAPFPVEIGDGADTAILSGQSIQAVA